LGGGPSREHIFPEAFGGRKTILACTDCNSGVGTGVEGRLLGSNSALTFFQQGSGLAHKELTASSDKGQFRVDLATGQHTAILKVNESVGEEGKTHQIFGTPEEARGVIEGLRRDLTPEHIQEIIDSNRIVSNKSEMLTMNITLDLVLVRRLIAKVSLCALTYLQGDDFISSDLAKWLRQVLDAPKHWGKGLAQAEQSDPAGVGSIDWIDTEGLFGSFQTEYLEYNATSAAEDFQKDKCQLIIWPLRTNGEMKTIFALSILGIIIPTGLVALDEPNRMFTATMFSETNEDPPVVRDLAQGLPNGY
jgi:hypothetical protein